jgi:4-amino-4-deoxy-L-arabinose transferase-like glycosyltransferase
MPPGDSDGFGARAPLKAGLVVAALALLGLVYVTDAVAWASRSDPWIWGDGALHSVRSILALRQWVDHGGLDSTELLAQADYGPLYYLVAAPVLALLGPGQDSFALVNALFGLTGLAGVFLVARSLAGPRAGLFAAFSLATLPLFRFHSFDGMLDQPGMSVAALALGALLCSDGFRRPGWSLLAGLATGLALLTRWPGTIGLVPVFWVVAVVAALRLPGLQRGVAVALGLASVAALALGFTSLPVLEPRFLGPSTSLGLLLAVGLCLGALSRRAPRSALGLASACVAVVGLAGPFYLCAREDILVSIAVHQVHFAREAGPDGGLYAGALARLVALVEGLRDWQLGGVGFALLAVGLAVGLWRPRSRGKLLLLLLFAATTWSFVLLTKRPLLERWVFPVVAALLPIAAAAPFARAFPGRRWVLAALALPLAAQAWGWWFPFYPGLYEPDALHGEVDFYQQDASLRPRLPPWGLGWAFLPHPFASMRPYGKRDRWHSTGMWDVDPDRSLRVAWLAHPDLPPGFDGEAARQALEQRLLEMSPRASLVEPGREDPWAAGHDAWVLVYPRGEPSLELEAARRVDRLWRGPIYRRDGVEVVLVRSHVVTEPDEPFDPEASAPPPGE